MFEKEEETRKKFHYVMIKLLLEENVMFKREGEIETRKKFYCIII